MEWVIHAGPNEFDSTGIIYSFELGKGHVRPSAKDQYRKINYVML